MFIAPKYECDGCGVVEPAQWNGDPYCEPKGWSERYNVDGTEKHYCAACQEPSFEAKAAWLPFLPVDLDAKVVCVEPIDGSYFRTEQRQRCIVRKDGKLYVSHYD